MGRNMSIEIRREAGLCYPELAEKHWSWPEQPLYSAVLFLADTPIGIIRCFSRDLCPIRYGTVILTCLGIGGVYIKSDFRGSGYADQLLDWVIENRSPEFAMAVLFSDTPRTLYVRHGFKPLLTPDSKQAWYRFFVSGIKLDHRCSWDLGIKF